MAKLPYTKTTIRDLSQYINIGDGSSGINIASIINAKTGPMERVTLTSFDDLVNYFCTGTAITQKDDTTVQCIGALLNSAPVDVIRVGTSKIKVGRTDNNKIFYTDSNYNVIPKLTRLSFADSTERENSLAITTDDTGYYVGDVPKKGLNVTINENISHIEPTNENLFRVISENVNCDLLTYNSTEFTYEKPTNFYDTYLTDVTVSYLDISTKITPTENYLGANDILIINDVSYYNYGDGTASNNQIIEEPKVAIQWFDNEISSKKFLSNTLPYIPDSDLVSYKLTYDFSNYEYSENLASRINNRNQYVYSKDVKIDNFYIIDKRGVYLEVPEIIIYNYNGAQLPNEYIIDKDNIEYDTRNVTEKEVDGEIVEVKETIPCKVISISDNDTDFARIINLFEINENVRYEILPVVDVALYLADSNVYFNGNDTDNLDKIVIDHSSVDGIYSCKVNDTQYQVKEDYSVFINGYTYYCGTEPNGKYLSKNKNGEDEDATIEYISLSDSQLTYGDFIDKLFSQLQADMVLGFINTATILLQGDADVKKSNNIKIVKSSINQTTNLEKAKFGLVSKFPSAQPLFSYSFVRNTDIENYDIIDITWIYNQISGTMSIGFDENACDDFGTLLYYTKYNEGDYENDYFHIMQFNDFIKWEDSDDGGIEEKHVDSFGNELIMREPSATDYANAIKKFNDYEDKQYSFIWDAGYASPILAKAMNSVAISKNAQFVPSYPMDYREFDEFKAYHQSLGLNTYEGIEIVPAFKGSYCGSFLTKVPGGLAYIVARVNSFNNVTTEYQPLFGPTRGAVAAPNLMVQLNKTVQQQLADLNINSIVSDINGTYLNFNLTSQKATSYLSEEQNVYMSNTIAHVCEEYNPKIIAEMNNSDLWNNVVNQLTQLIEDRLKSGKDPTLANFRVICDSKMNTQDVIEARQLKYKVEVQYYLSVSYITAYVDCVRLNSF